MFTPKAAFSGFSVNNLEKAKEFYTNALGLTLKDEKMGLSFALPGGGSVFIYQKDNHVPASYTALNFVVESIDAAVTDLKSKGVTFEMYEGMHQDENGIARGIAAHMGPDIAWFTDPAGNILSVLQELPLS
jgi:catechol 2,3-dioxygenase-like lactoylglutathione lyase family enzyme